MTALTRLTRRSQYLRVAAGRSCATPGLVMQTRPAEEEAVGVRIGFTASRKVGGAVVRNRARRRLKALAAALMPEHAAVADYVLIARAATSNRRWDDLRRDLLGALRRISLQRVGPAGPVSADATAPSSSQRPYGKS